MLSQIPGLVWVVIGVSLAIAAPWMIFVALDHQGRDRTGKVFQTSVDTITRTLRGENKEADELARRVDALKSQDKDSQK